jgi:ActR/RegA family two-component response regulator
VGNKGLRDWRDLAQKAANEKDPQKLLAIIEELNRALEDRELQTRGRFAKPSRPVVSSAQPLSKRVLFVDDEPSIRLTLPPILQSRGFEVRSAASVPEALAAIGSHKFDILLSDLNVSEEGDGFTIVHAMRVANPNCVTILLTGYPAFESAVEAIHHEVDDYFVKPADVESLISTMERKLLARRSQPSVVADE